MEVQGPQVQGKYTTPIRESTNCSIFLPGFCFLEGPQGRACYGIPSHVRRPVRLNATGMFL